MRSGRTRIMMAGVVALIAVVSYFGKRSLNPITGEAQYVSLTPEQEISIASYVGRMIHLKFGRADELEWDKFGVFYLHDGGYAPHALIGVMKILEEASGGTSQRDFEVRTRHRPTAFSISRNLSSVLGVHLHVRGAGSMTEYFGALSPVLSGLVPFGGLSG